MSSGRRRPQYENVPMSDRDDPDPISQDPHTSTDDGGLKKSPSRRKSKRAGSGRPAKPDSNYQAIHADFERHYGSKAQPPLWTGQRGSELQTYYDSLGNSAQTQLARRHNNNRQFIHLLSKVLFRWVVSFVLACIMGAVFYSYEMISVLNKNQRRWFNGVSTGLYLTLGLNLAASLKGMALLVRWKLLSRKRHNLQEIDFILGIHSLIKVFQFMVYSLKRNQLLTCFFCFLWILVNAIGRLSVALTGLTYSYDSANATIISQGLVNVTNWTTFSQLDAISRARSKTPNSENYAAHSYGLFSVILEPQNLTEHDHYDVNDPFHKPIEIAPNGTFIYFFRDYSPDTSAVHRNLAYKTMRNIVVSSACNYFPLTFGQNGDSSTVSYLNGTTTHSIHNISEFGPAATTWINPRSDLPKNAHWDCGPRCAAVAALQFLAADEPGNGAFYDCEVTVSHVYGATLLEHEVPDSTAKVAAGSIALEGYSTGPDGWEYVRYPPESPWSNYNVGYDGVTEYMAQLAGRYAIGAIATKDMYGGRNVQIQGERPWVGVLLKIKWMYLFLILGMILAVQLLMGVTAVIFANTVFCKDDSYLSTARLLRPIVERLGPSGCALTGKDIAHTLQQSMCYGVRSDEGGDRHHLDMGEDIQARGWFPEGWYDGEVLEATRGKGRKRKGKGKKRKSA